MLKESTMKKFGNKTLSHSAPVQAGTFTSIFADAQMRSSLTENTDPRIIERTEEISFASKGSRTEGGFVKKRKVPKKKDTEIALEHAIKSGHDDDIAFLIVQTGDNPTHKPPNSGFYKVHFILPEQWTLERQDRCSAWLVDELHFVTQPFASGRFLFTHSGTSASEFNRAARKGKFRDADVPASAVFGESASPRPGLALVRPSDLTVEIPMVVNDEDDASRPKSNKRRLPTNTRAMQARSERNQDSESECSAEESSPAMAPTPSFSPRSSSVRSSSRNAQSPHFGGRPRALTSPADTTLVTFMENTLHIRDSALEGTLKTTKTRPTTRSRGNSDGTQDSLVQAKSRGSSGDFSSYTARCPSRSGPTILEDVAEDVAEEDELAAIKLSHSSSVSTMQPTATSMEIECESQGTLPMMSSAISPVIPKPGSFRYESQQHQALHAEEDAAYLSEASTVKDESSAEEGDDEGRSSTVGELPRHLTSASRPAATKPPVYARSSTASPVRTVPACSFYNSMPADLAPDGPVMTMALKAEDLPGLRNSVPVAHQPTRHNKVPDRPIRKQNPRQLKERDRSATVPAAYKEHSSPSATQPAPGMSGFGAHAGHFHTPVALKPIVHVDRYAWEDSEAVPDRIIALMKMEFQLMQELNRRPPLQRAISDPYASSSSFMHSTPGNGSHEKDFLRMVGGYSGIGFNAGRDRDRDSMGSTCSNMKALVSYRQSLGGGDDESVAGDSPIHTAQQAITNHLTNHRARSSLSSLLGTGASPNAAFTSLSARNSPGSQFTAGAANAHRMSVVGFSSPAAGEGSTQDRLRKKKRQSEAKFKRRSLFFKQNLADRSTHHNLQSIAETSQNDSAFLFSPPKPKMPSAMKTRVGRRSSAMHIHMHTHVHGRHNMNDVSGEHSGCEFDRSFGNASHVTDSSLGHGDGHLYQPMSRLNEFNFKAIVVGGVYQHNFDHSCPLVAAPSASDKRVVDVVIQEDNSLVLSLYLPKDKSTKAIDLGTKWLWMRCSPTGYLAFRSAVIPNEQNVCYFLPKHPDDWKSQTVAAAARKSIAVDPSARNRRMSIVPQHEFNPRPRPSPTARLHTSSPGVEMDCQPLEDLALAEDAVAGDEEALVTLKMHSDDDLQDLDLSVVHQPTDVDVDALRFSALDLAEAVTVQSEHWSNAHVMALVLDFLIDDAALVASAPVVPAKAPTRRRKSPDAAAQVGQAVLQLQACQSVSKTWALAAYMVIAKRKSCVATSADVSFDLPRFQKFTTKFQSGMYLSQGACKNVYAIYNPGTRNLEALSVMDINDLCERDMDLAVTQEIQISLLCSAMTTLKICPNLVQVNTLFQADYNAPTQLWGAKKPFSELCKPPVRVPTLKASALERGSFQYIRTEFCSGGDVEERLRGIGAPPDLSTVRSMLFQMCFSLYACREKLCLRHFDVKLLNFFVTTSDILHASSNGTKADCIPAVTHLQIGLGQHVYNLPMQKDALTLIKLADFGTSAVGCNGLGDQVTLQQFTTLENSPPEFLLLGSAARQSYASDTFPLGLCFFHLLTGYAPYEELLADVHCPPYLADRLRAIWLTEDDSSPFYLINEVVESLDTEGIVGQREDVLLDTLYRYLVLFGLNDEFGTEEAARSAYCDSPVWKVLYKALDLKALHGKLVDHEPSMAPRFPSKAPKKGLNHADAAGCTAQYLRDVQRWSVRIGNDAVMTSFRNRLHALGNGADELLASLLHFDPARRCTMYDALQHPMFACLRLSPAEALAAAAPHAPRRADVVRYLHYHRPPTALPAGWGALDAAYAYADTLPIL